MKKGFSIKNMTVKKKITLFSVMIIILMLIISSVGLWASMMINQARSARYNNYAMGQYYLSEAYSDFADIRVCIRDIMYVYHDDSTNLKKKRTEMQDYEKNVQEYSNKFEERLSVFDSDVANQFNMTVSDMEQFMQSCEEYADMVESGDVDQARSDIKTTGSAVAAKAEQELIKLQEMIETASDENNDKLEKDLGALQAIILVVAIVAVLISIIYCGVLIRAITVPVAKLSIAAKKMAIGDVDVDCEKTADDDLGALMDNFKEMLQATKEQAEIATEIAGGDLSMEVTPRSNKDVLGKALRKLVENQSATIGTVKESAVQVTVGAEQVASASQSLAQGSTEQASALQEVTASIDEIAERTKKNASVATEANNLVHTVREMAADGKGQMTSMVSAMTDISESSEMISKIIKTIDDISFQTNILSLNAAVEAARAGIHGKGFAVVAEEVRNLAAKSASAAKETAEMIEDSIRKVDNGQKLAVETSQALDKIVESIESVTGLMTDMAESSNEQATAISQVDQAITQVSTVVQTNSATSEQCAAASEELSNQAVSLKTQLAGYKIAGGSNPGTAMVSADTSDSFGSDSYNEQLISLDDEFGKY